MNPCWTPLFISYLYNYFLQWALLSSLLSEFPRLQDHFLLAAVNKGANNCIAAATAMHTAATVTNTRRTTSPVTPSHTRDALKQMLGLTARFSDVSHISLELEAVATAVCKHSKSSIRTGESDYFF